VRADRRRRASEGRFRDFAAAGSDWFWETDAAGRFTFVSARFAELAELDPASLIGRTRVEAGLNRDSDPASWARLQEEMARHLPVRGFRYPFRTASGRLRHLQISGRPFRDEAGRFFGYRGAGSDVTHEVEAQSALTFLAKHDALTELPNRALLDERLRQDLARAGREGPLAVLRVAERLAGPPRDTAARAAALQGLLRRLPGPAAVEPPLDRHGGHPGDLGAPGNGQAPARGVDVDVAARVAQLLVPGRPLAVPGAVAAARVVDTLDRMLGGRTRAHVL
jgi:PAS domain S-box-containing protein